MAAKNLKMEIINKDTQSVEQTVNSNSVDYLYRKWREFFMTGDDVNQRVLSHECRYYKDGKQFDSIYDLKNNISSSLH